MQSRQRQFGTAAHKHGEFIQSATAASHPIPNLFLASDYVQTMTNLATMEGACEAGRAAALGLLLRDGWNAGPRPQLFPLVEPAIFNSFKTLDKIFNFPLGLPPPCPTNVKALKKHWKQRKRHGR